MLIAMSIWQNSYAVLLRRIAARRKVFAFRHHIIIIKNRRKYISSIPGGFYFAWTKNSSRKTALHRKK
jgi:hypothetical protein